MTAKVSIIVEGKNNILVIPASYIETVYNSNSNSETSFNIS
jgi:hypothetical protein